MARLGSREEPAASDAGRWPLAERAATAPAVAALAVAWVVVIASVLVVASLLVAGPATATFEPEQNATQQPPDAILVVADAETGRTLLGLPVENGTTISLNYTHSVEKTPVIDTYEVQGDRLVMTRMEFSSFGAGLPSQADVNRTDEGTYAFDPPGAYEEIYVQPGSIAGHRLEVGNQTFDLVELSNASSVRIHLADCEAGASATATTNTTTTAEAST